MKKRILIIDDNEGLTKLLKLALEWTGSYEVQEAHSGRSGLETARQFHPDKLLLDVMMPDMDGGDVARHILSEEIVQENDIVFMTSLISEDDTLGQRMIRGGFRFLSKPVNLKEVVACLIEGGRTAHCAKN